MCMGLTQGYIGTDKNVGSKKLTNYEKIKSMSVDEMANYLSNVQYDSSEPTVQEVFEYLTEPFSKKDYEFFCGNYLANSKTVYEFYKDELEIIRQALNNSIGFYHSGDDEYKKFEELCKKVNSMLEGKWNSFFNESEVEDETD